MAPILYMLHSSPPSRAVLMTAKYLNIELENRICDIVADHQFKEDFLKLNPAHTVPTLVDNGFVLWESGAIMAYLVEKYAKDDSLYPKDIEKRAIIDQLLHFSTSSFTRLTVLVKSVLIDGKRKYTMIKDQVQLDGLLHNLDIVEKILGDKKYLTGDNLTLADLSFLSWISTWDISLKIAVDRYPKIIRWWKRLEKLPFYESNLEGIAEYDYLWINEE